jgi:hypothetical protein
MLKNKIFTLFMIGIKFNILFNIIMQFFICCFIFLFTNYFGYGRIGDVIIGGLF